MLPIDVIRIADAKAAAYKIPPANLSAIIDVESGGKVFATVAGEQRPLVLFEPHLFYRRLSGRARDEAVSLGLASARRNKKLYPKTQAARWRQIQEAEGLLKRHGLPAGSGKESASYGVGQVLGKHWKALGYLTLDHFMRTMLSGAAGQIEVMLKYIIHNDLLDELQEGRWEAFARGYNGPGYAKTKYHTRMAAAALVYGGKTAGSDGMLRLGSKGARVRELQTLLVRAGHPVKVDGDFGPATKKSLKAFQKANGITVDGVYGPETEAALNEFRQPGEKIGDQKPTEIKEVVEGIGTAVGGPVAIEAAKKAVEGAKDEIVGTGIDLPIIDYLIAGLGFVAAALAIAGLLYALYGWWKSKKTVEV